MSIGMQQYMIKQTGGSLYFVDTGVLQKQEFNVLNVRIQLQFFPALDEAAQFSLS